MASITGQVGRVWSPERLRPAFKARGRVVDVAAVLLAIAVGYLVGGIQVGSGDYGQWLMLSRFYMGLDIPSYREVGTVPPLLPLLLAAAQRMLPHPVAALQTLKGLLACGLVLAFYLAGAAIFRLRAAGLLGAGLAVYATDRILEPFAFGGLPQLLGLLFTLLSAAAFGRAGIGPGRDMRWWCLGSLGVALAGLSHLGTGLISSAGMSGLVLARALSWRRFTLRQLGLALLPLGIVLLGLGSYYTLLLAPANQEYVRNPALQTYRGPDLLWDLLRSYPLNLWLLAGGLAALVAGGLRELRLAGTGGFLATAGWAVGVWSMLALSILSGTDTDYPRFSSLLLPPLAIALGGGAARVALRIGRSWPGWLGEGSESLPLALAALLGLGLGPGTLDRHVAQADGYSVTDLEALVSAARWLDAQLPQGQSVLTTAREGKWVEGLTGRDALFSLPVHFSFRSAERPRGMAADSLLRSVTGLSNEFLLIKYANGKSGRDGLVPRDPWVAINHGGEYVDVARIPSTGTVVYGGASGQPLATLNALEPAAVRAVRRREGIALSTVWEGVRGGRTVSYARTVSLRAGSPNLELIDQVLTDASVGGIEVGVRLPPWAAQASILTGPAGADLLLPPLGSSRPRIRLTAPGQRVEMIPRADGVLVRAPGARRLRLLITAPDPGPAVHSTHLLLPGEIVERYRVGAVVLRDSPDRSARLQRLALLGFEPRLRRGPYTVLLRTGRPAIGLGPAPSPWPGPVDPIGFRRGRGGVLQ